MKVAKRTHIRHLNFRDLKPAIELEKSFKNILFWYPFSEDELGRLIKKGHTYGIFVKNNLIGKVGFVDFGKDGWEVDGMIIDEKYRGQNIGTELLKYALEQFVKTEKPKKLFLFVYPGNSAAVSLYLSFGFIIIEWISNKFGKDKHRLKMVKML